MMDTILPSTAGLCDPCGHNGGGRQLCDGHVSDNFEKIRRGVRSKLGRSGNKNEDFASSIKDCRSFFQQKTCLIKGAFGGGVQVPDSVYEQVYKDLS